MIKDAETNTLLLGDSNVACLSRYPNVWNEYFAPINALNLEEIPRKCSIASHRFAEEIISQLILPVI